MRPVLATPPIEAKLPPAYKLVPITVKAFTKPDAPVPNALHVLPFHFAIRLPGLPPAVVNVPATYTSDPLTAIASTVPSLMPVPRALQIVPFHKAILFAFTPPAAANIPPTYTFEPLTVITFTLELRAGVIASQTVPVEFFAMKLLPLAS
jgi:hypothetical protein